MAALGAAAPALACMPALMEPSSRPERGEGCAIAWVETEIRKVGLSPGTDLGGGFVMQDIFDGNACYWEANLIIHDCAAAAALVIGHDDRALMSEPRTTGIDRIARAAGAAGAGGAPLPLDRLEAMAAEEGYGTRLRLSTSGRIDVNGRVMRIDCACRTFYPRLRPGN